MTKTSKPLSLSRVAKRLVPAPSPPQPPELALPQILAAVVTGGNPGQVENLAEPTFSDCCPEGGDPWPMLILLSAKFEKQKACMQFQEELVKIQIPGLHLGCHRF